MPYKTIQQNFANGELNPKMQGRADVDMYYKSAQKMRDVVTTPYGGFVRRPGSTNIAELTSAYELSGEKNIKVFPFVFNNEQSYLLVVTDSKLDIFYQDVLIKTLTVTQFSNDRIQNIRYSQTADTAIFVHPEFQPIKLVRTGDYPLYGSGVISDGVMWAASNSVSGILETQFPIDISDKDFEFGFRVNTYGVGDSNPFPDGRALMYFYDNTGSEFFRFSFWENKMGYSGSAINKGIVGEECYIKALSVWHSSQQTNVPKEESHYYDFKLSYTRATGVWQSFKKRDDDEEWVAIDSSEYLTISQTINRIKLQVIQHTESMRNISIDLNNTYVKVNNVLAWDYNESSIDWVIEPYSFDSIPTYDFYETTPTSAQVSATPDQLDGTVKITLSGGISTNLVGQYIEGNGGRVKITSQNGTTLTGYTVIGFYSTDTIGAAKWTYTTSYEPVWSAARGWPCSVTFHGGRLWFGGSKSRPQTVWGSKVGLFNKFDPTSGYDNDAIEFTLDTSELNRITDIYSQKNLLIFTLGGEFVCATSYNEPITPDNVNAIKQTSNGSWDKTHPVDIEGTVMFVERKGQGLMSFAASDNTTDIYNSANSSLINSHLIKSPIDISVERNNLTQQTNYVYIVNEDGTMAVVNLLASQGITGGYTLWRTQGKYKSVCVLPDDTYVAVERYTANGYKLYLEKLTDSLVDGEETATLSGETSYTNSRFANKDIDMFVNGKFCGNLKADSDGIITFPAISGTAILGPSFRWEVESNFLEIPQLGVGLNRKKRLATMTVRTLDTPELTVNGETQPGGEGIKDIEYYGIGDWSEHPTWIMQEQRPCKVNVMAVQMNVNYQVAGDEY